MKVSKQNFCNSESLLVADIKVAFWIPRESTHMVNRKVEAAQKMLRYVHPPFIFFVKVTILSRNSDEIVTLQCNLTCLGRYFFSRKPQNFLLPLPRNDPAERF